jgi:serine/threonine protein kinase
MIGATSVIDYSASDAFGLGCVLFNMMSTASPFNSSDYKRASPNMSSLPNEYSSSLRTVVRHLLSSDAKQRMTLYDAMIVLQRLDTRGICECGVAIHKHDQQNHCQRCRTVFGLVSHRRHQCPKCKSSFCASCSSRTLTNGSSTTKVCEWCYRSTSLDAPPTPKKP